MKQKLKITNEKTFNFNIDDLEDVTFKTIQKYNKPGVWALFTKNENDSWLCLQVGQSKNIGEEIFLMLYVYWVKEN